MDTHEAEKQVAEIANRHLEKVFENPEKEIDVEGIPNGNGQIDLFVTYDEGSHIPAIDDLMRKLKEELNLQKMYENKDIDGWFALTEFDGNPTIGMAVKQ